MTIKTDLYIRWMLRRDFPTVLAIEAESTLYPWREEDVIRELRNRSTIGMVAEVNEQIVGYMIYDLGVNAIRLRKLAVSPTYRLQRIGAGMMDKLQSKLGDRRKRIICEVRETNLAGQLFLRSQGFFAISLLRDHVVDYSSKYGKHVSEDAYLMQYRLGSDV